jgi:hypothetical protein
MELEELVKQLPEHWESWTADESRDVWWDDGRDYDKPVFIRKDKLARIYFNNCPDNNCVYSIAFDYHSDGECYPTLKEAIEYCEWYLLKFPLEYHKCNLCPEKAIWHYEPNSSKIYYCDRHVPRGCDCNIDEHGNEILEDVEGTLRELPCCEYIEDKYGFPID